MKPEKPIKRPYATHYFSDASAPLPDYTSQGAAKTPEGAVRASVYRIFTQEFAKCVIHDRVENIDVYTVRFGASGLQVHYGSTAAKTTKLYKVR